MARCKIPEDLYTLHSGSNQIERSRENILESPHLSTI